MVVRPMGFGDDSLGVLVAVIIPAVGLFVWLFNSYKLGRFKRKRHSAPQEGTWFSRKKVILGACCVLLAALVGLLLCYAA